MKKLSKILAVLASLCLLLAALVFAVYANGEAVEGKFAVGGVGYETFEEAALAAGGRKTIKLNEDITLNEGLSVSSAVILDLNCHKLSLASGTMFTVSEGGDLVLRGKGSIKADCVAAVESGAKLAVRGLSTGIDIADNEQTPVIFNIGKNASAEFSGKITYTPTGLGATFLSAGETATAKPDTEASVIIKGANITVTEPSSDAYHYVAAKATTFAKLYDGANVDIDKSTVDVQHGDMFALLSGYAGHLTASQPSYSILTEITSTTAHPGFSIYIDADDSKLYAKDSKYCYIKSARVGGSIPAGVFMSGTHAPVEARFDNVDIVSATRIFEGGASSRKNYKVPYGQIYFKDVNYTTGDYSPLEYAAGATNKTEVSAAMMYLMTNLIWDGGHISSYMYVTTQVGTSITAADAGCANPFDAEAKEYMRSTQQIEIDESTHVVSIANGEWTYYTYTKTKNQFVGYGTVRFSDFLVNDAKTSETDPYYKLGSTVQATSGEFALFSGILFKNYTSDHIFLGNTNKLTGHGTNWLAGTKATEPEAPAPSGNVLTTWAASANSVVTSTLQNADTYVESKTIEGSNGSSATESKGYVFKDGNGYFRFEPLVNANEIETEGFNPYELSLRISKIGDGIISADPSNGGNVFLWATNVGTLKPEESVDTWRHALNVNRTVNVSDGSTFLMQSRFKYIVHEFDVSTDMGEYPITTAGVEFTTFGLKFDDNGNPVYVDVTKQLRLGNIVNGVVQSSAASGVDLETIEDIGGTPYVLPTNGAWARYTYVYEIGDWSESEQYTLTLNDTDYIRSRATLEVKIHFFVNGVWQATASNVMLPVDDDCRGKLIANGVRLDPDLKKGTSLCVDNPRVSMYAADVTTGECTAAGAESLAALCANPKAGAVGNVEISYHPDNNVTLGVDPFAKVDGVNYYDEGSTLNAIKEGSVVELYNGDITQKIDVDESFTLIPGEYNVPGFISETHVAVEYDGVVYFIPAAKGEIIDVVYESEPYEKEEFGKATIGSCANPEVNLYEGEFILDGAKYKKVISWTDPNDDGKLAFDEMTDGKIVLVPIYLYEQLSFEINKNGEISYYSASDGDITEALNALVADGSVIVVKLYVDTVSESGAAIIVPKGGKLYFDLNGNALVSTKNNGAPVFSASENSEFYLYSSKAGGTLVASVASVENNTAAQVKGGSVWTYTAASVTADGQSAKAYFGSVKNEALGIDAVGTNLTAVAAEIAKTVGFEAGATPAFTAPSAEIGVVGGTYVRLTDDGAASFSAGINTSLDFSGATLVGCGPHFAADSGSADAKLTLNVENSAIVVTDESLTAAVCESVFGDFSGGSSATVTGSTVFGTLTSGVKLGAGTKLAYAEALDDVTLGEGLLEADAYAAESVTFAIPAATEALSVGAFVTVYIDSPENLAKFTFYNSDNTTVIGESWNAPFGEIVVDPAFEAMVDDTFGNEWWKVGFGSWQLPELAPGEYDVFPNCDKEIADVKCLDLGLTLFTDFRLDYYLPSTYEEGFVLIGITTDEAGQNVLPYEVVTVDGTELVMFYEYVDASFAASQDRYIHFVYESTPYVQKITYGVEYYASVILGDTEGKYSDGAKDVVANAVRYANESYKAENGMDHDGLAALLSENGERLYDMSGVQFTAGELGVNTSSLLGIASVKLGYFDGKLTFMLVYDGAVKGEVKLPDAPDGGFAEWPVGNKGYFTYAHYKNYVGFEKEAVLLNNSTDANGVINTEESFNAGTWDGAEYVVSSIDRMRIEDLTSVVNFVVYKPDGTVVRASYSLAAYLTETGSNPALEAAYALALEAQNYAKNS